MKNKTELELDKLNELWKNNWIVRLNEEKERRLEEKEKYERYILFLETNLDAYMTYCGGNCSLNLYHTIEEK